MPEDSKTVRTLAEQTLPDFLFSVILEQRKSIATLIDALNEAKAGIEQLTASVERSEESRRQTEELLERQAVVESDLKFDLTQCRQNIDVLRSQVGAREEDIERVKSSLFTTTEERDQLREKYAAYGSMEQEILELRNTNAELVIKLALLESSEEHRSTLMRKALKEEIDRRNTEGSGHAD